MCHYCWVIHRTLHPRSRAPKVYPPDPTLDLTRELADSRNAEARKATRKRDGQRRKARLWIRAMKGTR